MGLPRVTLPLQILLAVSMVTAFSDSEEDSFSSSVDSLWEPEYVCDCTSVVCPPSPDNCPHGRVIAPGDTCGCCYVCGNQEWNYCDPDPVMYPEYFTYYLPWEKLPRKPLYDPQEHKFGRCGWGLQCLLRDDMGPPNSLPIFVCTCQDEDIVCGSDGKTYENPCELREKAAENNATVAMKTRAMCLGGPIGDLWGTCAQLALITAAYRGCREPIIVTPPMNFVGDSAALEDSLMVLSCVVNANPPASISWTKNDNLIRYMGPNRRKSIHSRPGISIYAKTSWLKVYGARKTDIGNYKCVATNSHGTTVAASVVDVVPEGTI